MSDLPPVATVQQVADYLQVNRTWVYEAAKSGTIKGTKIGKAWRFRRADVDALMAVK